ncbi:MULTISPECIES: VOC family protein [unclassified Streptomyces]|uniref:VOC family protein n=1 Tax=unclassified Streptomyces TaxID=2593676 RepID=UPI00336AC412
MKTELGSLYPVIATRDVAASHDFYARHFGFEATFEAERYVSVHRPDAPQYELALLDHTEYERLVGQRHFIGAAPDGVMIDVITAIPVTGECAGQYTAGHAP